MLREPDRAGRWQAKLDELRIRPRLGKGADGEQVGPGEALHLWEGIAQIPGEPLDLLRLQSRTALALEVSRPICQSSSTCLRLTLRAARCWAWWMRTFSSASQGP